MAASTTRLTALATALVRVGTVVTIVLLGGCAIAPATSAVPTTSAVASPEAKTPASSAPTPTVTVVDPESFPVDTGADSDVGLIGASFDGPNPNMHCGIYTNWPDQADANVRGLMFGCRMEEGYTFTYPAIADKPPIGGCPSGFIVTGDRSPAALCNSGQVFASEIGTAHSLKGGDRLTYAGVRCDGLEDGVRCVNLASAHGFMLTSSNYSRF